MNRVLIVDDAIDLGRMLQDALKTVRPDLAVVVVPSAEEALLEATRFAVDLLVTDLRLPGMTGFELIHKIRVRRPQVKVILMTGMVLNDRLEKEKKEIGPDVFIRKPVSATAFLDYVEQLLGKSERPALAKEEHPKVSSAQPAVKQAVGQPAVPPAEVLREMAAVMPGLPAETKPLVPQNNAVKKDVLPGTSSLSEEGLSGVLSRLRGSLGALCTMLMDDRGHSVAQAGDLPDTAIVSQLVSPLMASLSSGEKISHIFGQGMSQSVQGYHGSSVDLLVAPVGQYVLLIWLRSSRSALRLAIAFEEALNAQLELSAALDAMGLHNHALQRAALPEVADANTAGATWEETAPSPETVEKVQVQDAGLKEFEALLTQKVADAPNKKDADAFWDNASGQNSDDSQPGVLSFEQAQKLGLLPPEK